MVCAFNKSYPAPPRGEFTRLAVLMVGKSTGEKARQNKETLSENLERGERATPRQQTRMEINLVVVLALNYPLPPASLCFYKRAYFPHS